MIYVLLGFAYILWVYWHRFEIKNDGDLYLVRYKLLRTPWFRIFLHRIHRADQDRPLHNHPWPNAASLILWGGYAESTLRGWYFYALGDRNRLTPETYHRIDSVLPGTWTLFFAGRRSRSWGFLTERGHVDYREYLGLPANHQLED